MIDLSLTFDLGNGDRIHFVLTKGTELGIQITNSGGVTAHWQKLTPEQAKWILPIIERVARQDET